MSFVLIQIIGAIGYLLLFSGYYLKNKDYLSVLSYLFLSIHYFLLAGTNGAINDLLIFISMILVFLVERKFVVEKHKKLFTGLFCVFILFSLFISNNIYSLYTLIATAGVFLILLRFDNRFKGIRYIISVCWLFYAICYCSYVGILVEFMFIVFELSDILKANRTEGISKRNTKALVISSFILMICEIISLIYTSQVGILLFTDMSHVSIVSNKSLILDSLSCNYTYNHDVKNTMVISQDSKMNGIILEDKDKPVFANPRYHYFIDEDDYYSDDEYYEEDENSYIAFDYGNGFASPDYCYDRYSYNKWSRIITLYQSDESNCQEDKKFEYMKFISLDEKNNEAILTLMIDGKKRRFISKIRKLPETNLDLSGKYVSSYFCDGLTINQSITLYSNHTGYYHRLLLRVPVKYKTYKKGGKNGVIIYSKFNSIYFDYTIDGDKLSNDESFYSFYRIK